MISLKDTIASISTPIGQGAISIVRLSGSDSINILKKIFKTKHDLDLAISHTIIYGHIYTDVFCKDKKLIDEVLVSIMLAPKTYTTQDIVEINCHGGINSSQLVLETVLRAGARLATPGEFTKRAFLNGRIDLAMSEGIIDIIHAQNNVTQSLGINMLKGKLSNIVTDIRQKILTMIAHIEASIDYPEDDLEDLNKNTIAKITTEILAEIDILLKNADKSGILKDGIDISLIGRPNVGKSSLLNALLNEDRAIVTSIAGTTRDIIKETINIDGLLLNILDTAGIHQTTNEIEQIGIEKSKLAAQNADLVLLLIDTLEYEDLEILNKLKDKNVILIANKNDLNLEINIKKLPTNIPIVKLSAKEKTGLDILYKKIKTMFDIENINIHQELILSRARHKEALKNTTVSLKNVLQTIEEGFPEDVIAIDLQEAYEYLGHILGETISEDIIDKIFSEFCLGK